MATRCAGIDTGRAGAVERTGVAWMQPSARSHFIGMFRLLRLETWCDMSRVPLEEGTYMNMQLEERDDLAFAEKDSELAASASRALARAKDSLVKVTLDDGTELALPKAVRELLVRILTEVSHGNMVNLVPVHAELSTQEAANLLNVSRPHLIKLLERGDIPHHKAGSHRRVKFTDLREYQEKFEAQREAAMAELAKQAQELRLGY